eukprot:CAMPEP_0196721804 /NCGR_PEP_ID=MMETSP1091-20130531/4286_1 /TAXON_ID=302021 /ORGANISM="Rhodomonas sp., Strain CCMP768" /LENGTH=124 /DNA_ID=CAMNT_0042063369 /DNA_START=67 /DNA_END=438 /DNA_ORIENTATION=+
MRCLQIWQQSTHGPIEACTWPRTLTPSSHVTGKPDEVTGRNGNPKETGLQGRQNSVTAKLGLVNVLELLGAEWQTQGRRNLRSSLSVMCQCYHGWRVADQRRKLVTKKSLCRQQPPPPSPPRSP